MGSDFFDALGQVINPNFCITIDSMNRLILSEEQNSGREGVGQKVILKRKGKVFAFSLDQKGDIFPFFNNTTGGIKKCNDAILFCQDGDQWYVLIIELKSGNAQDGFLQLKSGYIFVEYLLSVIDLHYKKKIQPEFRFIIFHTKPSRKSSEKRPTRRLKNNFTMVGDMKIRLEDCNQVVRVEEFFAS